LKNEIKKKDLLTEKNNLIFSIVHARVHNERELKRFNIFQSLKFDSQIFNCSKIINKNFIL